MPNDVVTIQKMDRSSKGGASARLKKPNKSAFRDPAFMANRDAPVHRWVPWIAGYSKHFVEDALERHTSGASMVLDPFSGVGTTLVEADLAGHEVCGFEINPYAAFVAQTKLKAHRIDADGLRRSVQHFRKFMADCVRNGLKPHTSSPAGFRTHAPFYSPDVERKVLLIWDFISEQKRPVADIFRMAFAATMVHYSNYSYEPSLGRKAVVGRPEVEDYDVSGMVADKLLQIAVDAEWYRKNRATRRRKDGRITRQSFFEGFSDLAEGSADILITSPPYLNNYHYNRNTRPHLYWLGFCSSPRDMKPLEALNFGTYWQNARERDCIELNPSIEDKEIRQTLAELRGKNADKGIYGGNGWANYAAQYFNDCVRFAEGAAWCLHSGATALAVIGNSILQGVPIPTDRFFAKIAEPYGFQVINIHVSRDTRVGNSIVNSSVRVGKTNGNALRESVVELRRV